MERLKQQLTFLLEMDKLKSVFRQTYLADGSRKENDAEHSWHLGMMAFLLAEYANGPVDVLKTMKMVMLHDVIEIDAGDTYAYDLAGNKTKRMRELANTLDKMQPLLLNHASGGKSWMEHGVKSSQIMERNARTQEGSEALWQYMKTLIEENISKGSIKEG